jgi:hypothetical protein
VVLSFGHLEPLRSNLLMLRLGRLEPVRSNFLVDRIGKRIGAGECDYR